MGHKHLIAICSGFLLSTVLLPFAAGAQAQSSNAFMESYQLGSFPGKGNKAQWEQAYSYIQKTKNLKNTGHYDEAIEASQKAIEIYPDDANFYYGLGLTYCKRGEDRISKGNIRRGNDDLNVSEKELKKALELNKDWRIWGALGNTLHDLGKNKESLNVLNHAMNDAIPLPPAESKQQIRDNITALEKELQKQTGK
jgi:tetratricopeptide (TPR) repeat protein